MFANFAFTSNQRFDYVMHFFVVSSFAILGLNYFLCLFLVLHNEVFLKLSTLISSDFCKNPWRWGQGCSDKIARGVPYFGFYWIFITHLLKISPGGGGAMLYACVPLRVSQLKVKRENFQDCYQLFLFTGRSRVRSQGLWGERLPPGGRPSLSRQASAYPRQGGLLQAQGHPPTEEVEGQNNPASSNPRIEDKQPFYQDYYKLEIIH